MTFLTLLLIAGALLAFGYGVWAGLGRWDQNPDEIDRALTENRHRRKVTRHFTPLDLMSRLTGVRVHRDRSTPFRFESEEKEEERDLGPAPEQGYEAEGEEQERADGEL